MKTQIAQLTVTRIEPESLENERMTGLVKLINKNINPLTKLTGDDVYIRVMYIVSDEVNAYGGMFALEEMKILTELLINSPVLTGHRKDQLPIARNFHAEIESVNNRNWVKSYFYWLKDAEGSEHLKKQIDGGIYKECSIGFTFNFPECSICSKDIRRCPHEPYAEYKSGRASQACFYLYKEIEKVLETSLVYRGAVNNTSISDKLIENSIHVAASYTDQEAKINDIDFSSWYLATPYYDGIDITISKETDNVSITPHTESDINLEEQNIIGILKRLPFDIKNQRAIVVGYRGKERCRKPALLDFLSGKNPEVTRIDIKLFPNDILLKYTNIIKRTRGISLLNVLSLKGSEIEQKKSMVMTKDGLCLYRFGQNHRLNNQPKRNAEKYELYLTDQKKCYLEYNNPDRVVAQILNFSIELAQKGRRFLMQPVNNDAKIQNYSLLSSGFVKNKNTGYAFEFISDANSAVNHFRIQKVKLNNRCRYILQVV